MAEILSAQYSSVFSTPLSSPIDPKTLFTISNDPSKLEDFDFTKEDILKAIEDISPNSAPGPDRFPAIFLNECKAELSGPLHQIWRLSMDEVGSPCP